MECRPAKEWPSGRAFFCKFCCTVATSFISTAKEQQECGGDDFVMHGQEQQDASSTVRPGRKPHTWFKMLK